jgi:hypothetical protein
VAVGTLVLSSGGLIQGRVGDDEAFAITLTVGLAVIYAGFLVADGVRRPAPAPAPATTPVVGEAAHCGDGPQRG